MRAEEEITRVLFAEDDDDDFEMFKDVITDLGLKVVVSRAENGDMLLRILRENIPDMLFLDIRMPCKDGKDCLLKIRTNPKFDHLPIIVYSSINNPETIEFCFRQGTNMYVLKPSSFSELKEVVQRIFSVDWKRVRYYPNLSNFVLNPT
jgi:CheY-like chemotaxis protein